MTSSSHAPSGRPLQEQRSGAEVGQKAENVRPRSWSAFEDRQASAERWSVRRAELEQLEASTGELRAAVGTYVAAAERVGRCATAIGHMTKYRDDAAERWYWDLLRTALPSKLGQLRKEEIVSDLEQLVDDFDEEVARAADLVDRWQDTTDAAESIEVFVGRMAELAQQLHERSRQHLQQGLDDLRALVERLRVTAAQLPKLGAAPQAEGQPAPTELARAGPSHEAEAENVPRPEPIVERFPDEQQRGENRTPFLLRPFDKKVPN